MKKLILCLSGNPGAAVTGLLRVALPYLRKRCGRKDLFPEEIVLPLKYPLKKESKVPRLLRGRLEIQNGQAWFVETNGQGNGMLSAFCGTYPHVFINIVQGGTHHLTELLTERSIDLALLNHPVTQFPSHLEFLKLGEDRYSLAVPKRHRLANRSSISLSELKDEQFIFHQTGQVAADLCLNACLNAGFDPKIICRSSSPTVGLDMVQGGLGVAFLPSEEFRTRSMDGIVELKLEDPIIKNVGALRRRDSQSPLVQAFMDFALDWVRHGYC